MRDGEGGEEGRGGQEREGGGGGLRTTDAASHFWCVVAQAGGRDPRITLSRDESSFRILAAPDLPYPLKILSVLIFAGAGGVICIPTCLITLLSQNRIGNYSAVRPNKTNVNLNVPGVINYSAPGNYSRVLVRVQRM